MTRRKLNKAFEALDIRKQNRDYLIPGILGFLINGEQTVQVPGRDGYVYVRLRNNLNEVVQAYNDQVSPVYNLPVVIVRDEVDITRYKVQGRDLGVYQNWGTTTYLPQHGNQHSFNPEGGGGGDIVWVYSRQFMPLLVHPSGSSASPSVILEPYTFYDGSNWKYIGNTGTADLTTYKPTGSNARMVLIYVDEYGNPNYEPGSTYFNATITGTAEIVPYIPDPPTGTAIFSSAIRLVSGTSVINWANIYDVRPFFGLSGTSVGGGGAGGGAPTDAEYVTMSLNGTLTDERVLTAGADIDITDGGAGGNVTVGVTPNTFASGTHTHPAGTSAIQIYEDSAYKATGTLISFNQYLDVVATGTVAFVDVAIPDGLYASGSHTHYQGAITDLQHAIPIYNNDAFLVTGTALAFDTNLTATASGTFVYVNSTATGGGGTPVIIYDDSVYKATGTYISFNGDLLVEATGTSAFISIPAGTFASGSHTHPAGATAIQIFDDSAFVATGTAISFDSNLTAVASGTTVFVDSTGGGGGNSTYSDTFTNRPSGTVNDGDLFFPTDGLSLYRVTGTSSFYQPFGPLFPFVEPVNSDFTWINQGSGTVSATSGGIVLYDPAAAGLSVKIRKKSAPSTPYTITAAFIPSIEQIVSAQCGIGWRQSSDGKLILFRFMYNTGVSTIHYSYVLDKLTDPTTFSATYTSRVAVGTGASMMFFRIADDGVNRICSYGFDGISFRQLHSVGRTDFMTADEVCFFANSNNASYSVYMTLLSWKEE